MRTQPTINQWQPARLKINSSKDNKSLVTIIGTPKWAYRIATSEVRLINDPLHIWSCTRKLNKYGDLYAGNELRSPVPGQPFPPEWKTVFNTRDYSNGGNTTHFEVRWTFP